MANYYSEIDKDDWYAVWTKPRQEKRAKEQLINQGVKVFLPAVSTHITKKLMSPNPKILFPRYLFIKTNLTKISLTTLQRTLGIVNILCSPVSRKPIPVSPAIIASIEKLTQEWEEPPKLKVGQSATIKDGPTKGVSGIVQKLRITPGGVMRAYLLIDFLCKHQVWETDVDYIDPAY
jgi:transcriptional antiterminator RfaH